MADPLIRETTLPLTTPDGIETFQAKVIGTCLDEQQRPFLDLVFVEGHIFPPEIFWNEGRFAFKVEKFEYRTKFQGKMEKELTVMWLRYSPEIKKHATKHW